MKTIPSKIALVLITRREREDTEPRNLSNTHRQLDNDKLLTRAR
jgi:hypothetical protein